MDAAAGTIQGGERVKFVVAGVMSPCQNCPDRHEACHDFCEKFAEYKSKVQEAKDRRRDALRWTAPNSITRTKPKGAKP